VVQLVPASQGPNLTAQASAGGDALLSPAVELVVVQRSPEQGRPSPPWAEVAVAILSDGRALPVAVEAQP
jgi:hypothetical protein